MGLQLGKSTCGCHSNWRRESRIEFCGWTHLWGQVLLHVSMLLVTIYLSIITRVSPYSRLAIPDIDTKRPSPISIVLPAQTEKMILPGFPRYARTKPIRIKQRVRIRFFECFGW
jgi:hypothetical protein